MAYYGLEHSYSKFSGKKLKEQLSSFLPTLPGVIGKYYIKISKIFILVLTADDFKQSAYTINSHILTFSRWGRY